VAVSGKNLEIRMRDCGLGPEYSGDNNRMLSEIPEFRFHDMQDSVAWLYRWYEEHKLAIDPELLRFDE